MIHNPTLYNENNHYSVGYNEMCVLVQLQEERYGRVEQVRIPLTVEETEHLIKLLQENIKLHKEYDPGI